MYYNGISKTNNSLNIHANKCHIVVRGTMIVLGNLANCASLFISQRPLVKKLSPYLSAVKVCNEINIQQLDKPSKITDNWTVITNPSLRAWSCLVMNEEENSRMLKRLTKTE